MLLDPGWSYLLISACAPTQSLLSPSPGIAVGQEFCGPESPAVRDPNFWVVSIGEFTTIIVIL